MITTGQCWLLLEHKLCLNQFSSVIQLCLTFCDPMNFSTPGFPVHHQLLESTQIHVHWVGDAIQPSHSLSSRSPPALNLSQNQGLLCLNTYTQSQSMILLSPIKGIAHSDGKTHQCEKYKCSTMKSVSFYSTFDSIIYIYVFMWFKYFLG